MKEILLSVATVAFCLAVLGMFVAVVNMAAERWMAWAAQSREWRRLQDVARAADDLERFLTENVGLNDDWPLGIVSDSDEASDGLCRRLNALRYALDRRRPETPKPWVKS